MITRSPYKVKKTALLTIAIVTLLIPICNAVTIDGEYNFSGPNGGNVRFANDVIFTQYWIVNTLNQFSAFRMGGGSMGALGFDCETGVNMTIISVSRYQVRYNVSTALAGGVETYVHYNANDYTPRGTNTDSVTYNEGTDIATVTTTGNGVLVTLDYASISQPMVQQLNMVWGLIPLVAATWALDARRQGLLTSKALLLVLALAAVGFVIMAIRTMGY